MGGENGSPEVCPFPEFGKFDSSGSDLSEREENMRGRVEVTEENMRGRVVVISNGFDALLLEKKTRLLREGNVVCKNHADIIFHFAMTGKSKPLAPSNSLRSTGSRFLLLVSTTMPADFSLHPAHSQPENEN